MGHIVHQIENKLSSIEVSHLTGIKGKKQTNKNSPKLSGIHQNKENKGI